MKKLIIVLSPLMLSAGLQAADQGIPNPLIDYPAFLNTAHKVQAVRAKRRLTEEQFLSAAKEPGTIVLDARSESKFKLRHIKGAINLPFTEFTETALAKIIPSKGTPVLIYCNNNFLGSPVAFASKGAPASLNISTYVALTTYGYTNIYELGPLIDVKSTKLLFEGEEVTVPR